MIVPDWLNVDNTIYQKINDEYGQALWGLRLSNLDHSWGEYSLSAVKVAIIDSGIDYKHEDFDKTILPGYNFLDRNEDVNDHWGHGTAISGIIAAVGNNNVGIAGAAYGVNVIPLKVVDYNRADLELVNNALDWCIHNDVDIINISMGITERSEMFRDYTWKSKIKRMKASIRALVEKGVIIVSAIGNDGGEEMDFPSCMKEVIAVGAVGIENDSRDLYIPSFNNVGDSKTIYAPGEKIVTLLPQNNYGCLDGSSLATAFVTSAVAYGKSIKPEMNVWEAKQKLLETAGEILFRGTVYKMLNVDKYVSKMKEEI